MEIPGARIQVDSFKRGSDAYFLSHFHADHMANLRCGWNRGPLYASKVTGNLLVHSERADKQALRIIEPGDSITIDAGGPVTVKAIEANHCPGALMFVFETSCGRILYTGDFRYDVELHRPLAALGGFDLAFVDNTYDHPHYVFPSQAETIRHVVALAEKNPQKDLFLGLYTIGKTRLLSALAHRFEKRFYVPPDIYRAYKAMGAENLVTPEKSSTNFFGYCLGYFSKYFKMNYPDYRSKALVIIPTGWALDNTSRDGDQYVAYSEHCDWRERQAFLAMLGAGKVINLR
jgi:DNA cross-link repair 1B protein